MPVDEDINLDAPEGITQEQIDFMNRQADELQDIADKAEKNVNRIEKANQSVNKYNLQKEKNKFIKQFKANEDQIDYINSLDQDEFSEFKKLVIKSLEQFVIEQEKLKKLEEEVWDIKTKNLNDLKNSIQKGSGDFKNMFSQGTSIIRNPIGNGLSRLRTMAMAGSSTFLPIAVAFLAYEVGSMVYDEVLRRVKSMYEAGGALDVRKVIKDEMKQVANIEHMMAIHRGDVFFTSDTAEFIRQGISQNDSNARTRVYGHKQYIQEFDR